MPKSGFRTVTLPETLMADLKENCEKHNRASGIRVPLSTYVSGRLSEVCFPPAKMRFRLVEHQNAILIIDGWAGTTHEISKQKNASGIKIMFCKTCRRGKCIHIGAMYGLSFKHNLIDRKGWGVETE